MLIRWLFRRLENCNHVPVTQSILLSCNHTIEQRMIKPRSKQTNG